MTLTEESPLKWPTGVPRTEHPRESRYGAWNWAGAREELERELRLLGATDVVISRDGPEMRRSASGQSYGVAVYFTRNAARLVLPADRWTSQSCNLHAIALFVEALRAQERGGVAQVVDRTLSGFLALPPPPAEEPWWKVLGCDPDAGLEVIEMFYRARAKRAHPDAGGSQAEITRLNWAIERARAQLAPRPRGPEASA